jgi:uncharacterized protein (TIGR02594 family)
LILPDVVSITTEPRWLRLARSLIGTREIVGPKHSPTIMGWIKRLGAKVLGIAVTDDETAWCGTFQAFVMAECGLTPPPIAVRASQWGTWGVALKEPSPGAIMTFYRPGGGHVGQYVGEDAACYHILGGNQSNSVSITRIEKARCTAIRWPAGQPLPTRGRVQLTAAGAPVSRNEA